MPRKYDHKPVRSVGSWSGRVSCAVCDVPLRPTDGNWASKDNWQHDSSIDPYF